MPPGAPTPPTAARGVPSRTLGRTAFYAHLWLGVVFTVALLVIAVTGVLLNHKRGLGLMPDVAHEPAAPLVAALPLERLARIALDTGARAGRVAGTAVPASAVDRMDVRPRDGYVKVRLRDAASTEVTVELASGRVLHVGPRGDVFLEKLHSGEILGGQPWVLLSDAAAVALVVTLATGYWLWLAPKRPRPAATPGPTAPPNGGGRA